MKYCRYCIYCVEHDCYICTLRGKTLKRIDRAVKCKDFERTVDLITGKEYEPRKYKIKKREKVESQGEQLSLEVEK